MSDVQLNKIGDRLREIRKESRITVVEIAKALGIARESYYQFEQGKTSIGVKHLSVLRNLYNFNSDYILYGIEPKFIDILDNTTADIPSTKYQGILAPIPANAGVAVEYTQDWIDQSPQPFNVPGVLGPTVTFQVSGDSMEPYIKDGDYIVTQKISDKNALKSKMVLVIVTKDSIYLKETDFTPGVNAVLRSFNADYRPITLPQLDIREIYLPVKRLLSA